MTIDEFGRRLRAREITSAQITEECLQRIVKVRLAKDPVEAKE